MENRQMNCKDNRCCSQVIRILSKFWLLAAVICMVLYVDSSIDFCGQSVVVSATLHLFRKLTSSGSIWSLPNMIHIFIMALGHPLECLFPTLHGGLNWSCDLLNFLSLSTHTILLSKFTLNLSNLFGFCIPVHGLWFLLYDRYCIGQQNIHWKLLYVNYSWDACTICVIVIVFIYCYTSSTNTIISVFIPEL